MLFGRRKRVITRILLVEDEPLVAFDNESSLTADGYVDGYHIGYLHSSTIGEKAITNRNTYDFFGPHVRIGFANKPIKAIRDLPEAYRETLVLRLVEGMSGPEIAERTGLTPASVRVNLHRGMKLLREKLGIEES